MVLIELHALFGDGMRRLFMHHPTLSSLVVVLLVLFVAIGIWRGFARVRRPGAVTAERNPGPDGSYLLIGWSLRHMPGWFNRMGMDVGTWIAWATLPRQRVSSREYLRLVLDREPATREVWNHFHAYTQYLIVRLSICEGELAQVRFAPGHGDELRAWLAAGRATLYGTMHVGHSDLLGFLLGNLGGRAHMVRKKVGNSDDIDRLASRYAGSVSFIWINDWSRLILAMNDALRSGCSLAMQCDRFEYSSKREGFDFFGRRLLFPFTIYHLAIMHELPVTLSYAVAEDDDPESIVVHMPAMFHPQKGHERRVENFAAAREHFQGFLAMIEAQLRRTPYLWFNFTPMNPACADDASAVRRREAPAVVTRGAADLTSVV